MLLLCVVLDLTAARLARQPPGEELEGARPFDFLVEATVEGIELWGDALDDGGEGGVGISHELE